MDYWKNKDILAQEELLNDKVEQLKKLMRSSYLAISKNIVREIENLYFQMTYESGTVIASDIYKYDRYFKLLNSVNEQLQRLGMKQVKIMDEGMLDLYKRNSKLVGEQINFTTDIDEESMKSAIKRVWVSDGLTYSDRIWNDKSVLCDELMQGLIDCLTTGSGTDKLVGRLHERFNVSFSKAERLVRTELKHIQIDSTINRYKTGGFAYYQYLTARDDKVCDEPDYCKCLNMKVFPIDDTQHLPPQHPNCRCTILPYREEWNNLSD